MFTPPAIVRELARCRHSDFVARADRYRLSHLVNQPSTLSGWPHLRASRLRGLLRSRAPGAVTGDRVPDQSHARAATW